MSHPVHFSFYKDPGCNGAKEHMGFCLIDRGADVAREGGVFYVELEDLISVHWEQLPAGIGGDRTESVEWQLPSGMYLTMFEHWHGDIKAGLKARGMDWFRRSDVVDRLGNRLTVKLTGSISHLHGGPRHFDKQLSSFVVYTGEEVKTQIRARPFSLTPLGQTGKPVLWPWW